MAHVHPTRDDAVVAGLSEAVGGPVGEHVGRSRWWTPVRVLLGLAAVVFALGLVVQTPCVVDQWRDSATLDAHVCASGIADSYTDTGLVELAWPWSGDPETRARYEVLDQPALVGLWGYATARVTHVLAGSPDVEARYRSSAGTVAAEPDVRRERTIFVGVNALGLAALVLLTTLALARVHRRRPWDAAGFAAAPLLPLAALLSWDLLAVTAAAGALWAWSRRRPALTGVLIGVGAAAGVWPALLLVVFALDALRVRRLLTGLLPMTVSAVAAWAVANAAALLTGAAQWERFWVAAADRGPGGGTTGGSIWTIVSDTLAPADDTLRQLSWLLIAIWVAAVAALALTATRPARPSQVALLLIAGILLLRLSYEPQQALWLVPLAALARPRWRDLLVWQAGEVLFLVLQSWASGGYLDPTDGGQPGIYWIAVVVHVAATGYLVAIVARDVWWPGHDPVEHERGERRSQLMRISSNEVAV